MFLGLVQVEEDVACGVLTLLSSCFTDAKAAAARQSLLEFHWIFPPCFPKLKVHHFEMFFLLGVIFVEVFFQNSIGIWGEKNGCC